MSDANTNAAPATQEAKRTLLSLSASYFGPDALAAAIAEIQKLQSDGVEPLIFNGDWAVSGELPEGYGISIRPVSRGEEKIDPKTQKKYNERVNFAALVLAIPTLPALLAGGDEAIAFAHTAVQRVLEQKAASAVNRADKLEDVSLPYTIEAFIANASVGATGIGLKAFTHFAPGMLEYLAKLPAPNAVNIDKTVLRLVLQSSDFAGKLMPRIPQAFWTKLLNAAKDACPREGQPSTVFDHWLSTRDTVKAGSEAVLDADAIEFKL